MNGENRHKTKYQEKPVWFDSISKTQPAEERVQ
jgi:hypothetical protein